MHEGRIAAVALGAAFALAVGLYAVSGHLAPGWAPPGGAVLAIGVVLPFFTSGAEVPSVRVARKPMRKIEILGLLIFILMAVVMLAVGAALFCDWLAEPGSAPVGTPVELGPVSGELGVLGTIPVMALMIGVEVVGGFALIALYMLSAVGREG